jgi:DNA-binding Lrp family transcriptional regulator
MDALDERLVTLLRHDARCSVSDLAVDLRVSRATVRARMERLERSGDIIGYTVVLRADAVEEGADRQTERLRGAAELHEMLKPHDRVRLCATTMSVLRGEKDQAVIRSGWFGLFLN